MSFKASPLLCTHEAEGPCGMRIRGYCDGYNDISQTPCPWRKPDPKDSLFLEEKQVLELYEMNLPLQKIAEELHFGRTKVIKIVKRLRERGAVQQRDPLWVYSSRGL